jgi:hypothetical protein
MKINNMSKIVFNVPTLVFLFLQVEYQYIRKLIYTLEIDQN